MSTAEEGGASGNATNTSYGGGRAGGKFRKKPFRRQTTPYDRPPASLRVNSTNSTQGTSWLRRLVLEPASKLIFSGADRFLGFGSVFRRRLPPPTESNAQEIDQDQGNYVTVQGGEQEPVSGQYSQPMNSSDGNAVAELENLLNQKTFSRSEIAHLAELLQSRAADVSPGDASPINIVPALDSGRKKEFTILEGNGNDRIISSPEQVLESDIASPAELAKAYMGTRPSQVSPSALGMHNQLGRENMGSLAHTLTASKSPNTSLAKRTSVSMGAAEKGFITPRSRGRSAIYKMARTPYSRVHPTSILKGSEISSVGYARPSTSSSTFSPLENEGKFDSQPGTLKRRSSVLDDEIGSVGPMRRIRQKPNLLTSRLHHSTHGVGVGSDVKQKHQLSGEERNKVLKNSGQNKNECIPSTSYSHVPSKSKEVAAKILQQLEKISPKEKSSLSKLAAMQDKSSPKTMSSRLPAQATRSREDVDSSKLLLNFQDDPKSANKTKDPLPDDIHESSPKKLVTFKASTSGLGVADSVADNVASQPQNNRAFRMSAGEYSLDLDDVECNGLASRPLSKNERLFDFSHSKSAGESKNTLQSEARSFPGHIPTSTSEHRSGAGTLGKETSVITYAVSDGIGAAQLSQSFVSSVPVFDKDEPKEASRPHLFSFNSKAADKFHSLPSESTKKAESEPERSSSLFNKPISIGSEVRTPDSEIGFHIKPVTVVDTNGKCDGVSSATLNGPLVSSCTPVSFPAASSSDNHWISTSSAPLFTTSTSITNSVPTVSNTSTAAPSSGSSFEWAASSSLGAPVFNFCSSSDLSTTTSAVPKASILEKENQRAKIDINPSSGSSASLFSNFTAAAESSGNHFGSSFSNSSGNSLQSSIFASASKFPVFGAGTVSQGTSIDSVPTASVPAHTSNTGTSLGSLPTANINFGFTSASTSSSDINSIAPAGEPTSSLFKFSATPNAVSEGSATGSSSSATSSTFIFGGASVSSSAINTASAFSSSTSGMFSFGGSSSSSSATNMVSSTSAPTSAFGSSWQSQKSRIFGSSFTSASPSSGFAFSASTNAAAPPMAFNSSSTGASSVPVFSFASTSASASSTPSLPNSQPLFGVTPIGGGFAASPGNQDQMNAEDSMAEDPVPSSSAPIPHAFGQPSASSPPPTFAFGSGAPSQNNPFMFSGQQNQVPQQNPSSPFPATGSLEFNAGGSFSLGSTGGDKSGRKMVKISRTKNRKK